MSSKYPASPGAPPKAAAATAAEPRQVRRAVALPSADDPLAGSAGPRQTHGTFIRGTTSGAPGGSAAVPASPAPKFPSEQGHSADRRTQTAAGGPGGEPASEDTAQEGLPGAVTTAARATSASAARGGAVGRSGKPLLVAAAFAGAVLTSIPFVSHHGSTTEYEGLGQQAPVASQSPGADSASRPDGQASVMPLQDPAAGTNAPVVPQPEAGGRGGAASDGSGGAPSAGVNIDRSAAAPAHTTGPDGPPEKGPKSDEHPTFGPPINPAKGRTGNTLGPVGTLGAGVGVLASGNGDGNDGNGTPAATDRTATAKEATAPDAKKSTDKAASGTAASTKTVKAEPAQHVTVPVTAGVKPVKAATSTKTVKAEPAQHVTVPVTAGVKPVKAATTTATASAATPGKTVTPVKGASVSSRWTTRVITGTTALGPGEGVASNRMTITMRTDGNLVITDENGTTRWSSHTEGRGYKAVFQNDGHLVVYTKAGQTAWSSGTAGNPGAELVIQNDGNVSILSAGGAVLWSAGTQH
ncbi:hypothetical protein ABZ770_42355 [Streptomyces sp. NPDC006654]|uniref:hypothetical protein n=1 Tax=Streptomyces sp. NPDC006654 TaxID=3156897 RepID=UPI0033DBE2F4